MRCEGSRLPTSRMEVPSVLLSPDNWRVVRKNLAGGAQREWEVEVGEGEG